MSCKLSCSRKMFSGFKQTIALLAAKQVYQILLHNLKNLRVAVVNEKNFFFFSSQFSINMFWPIFFISLSCKSKFEIIKSEKYQSYHFYLIKIMWGWGEWLSGLKCLIQSGRFAVQTPIDSVWHYDPTPKLPMIYGSKQY